MGQQQPPLARILGAGLGLAVVGIGLFLVIYFSFSGVSPLPRLLMALCVPPLLLAVGLGGYWLVRGKPQN